MERDALIAYCDDILNVTRYKDYAPNGLQVEGVSQIKKIITGVTATQALIDVAIDEKADAILVHHGYFWKNEQDVITGIKKKRIAALLANNINLIGYHLPLDGHPTLGNNAMLGKLWGLTDITETVSEDPLSLVRLGVLRSSMCMEEFTRLVSTSLGREPLHLPGGPGSVLRVAWCSGGAQGYIEKAVEWGADVYISGEVSEQTTHLALENGIHYLSAGHHATERLGVKALGEKIAQVHHIEVKFVDIINPV